MRFVVIIVLFILSGCSASTSPTTNKTSETRQTTSDPAADLVHNFQVGRNLEQLANKYASLSQTYHMANSVAVVSEIHRLTPKYQAQWDANLAKAYAAHLTPDELRSLSQEGRKSPYYPKMQQQQAQISSDMHDSSTSIIQALISEAIQNSIKP